MRTKEQIADAIVELINSSPRSPRKEQLMSILNDDTPKGEPDVLVVGARPGASIFVTPDSRLGFDGFHVGIRQGYQAEPEEVALAIMEYLRTALLARRAPVVKVH